MFIRCAAVSGGFFFALSLTSQPLPRSVTSNNHKRRQQPMGAPFPPPRRRRSSPRHPIHVNYFLGLEIRRREGRGGAFGRSQDEAYDEFSRRCLGATRMHIGGNADFMSRARHLHRRQRFQRRKERTKKMMYILGRAANGGESGAARHAPSSLRAAATVGERQEVDGLRRVGSSLLPAYRIGYF